MNDKKKRGIGLRYAMNGIKEAIKGERNFRVHLILTVIVLIFSAYLHLSFIEWMFILFVIHNVLMTELINSIVEKIIDYVKPEYHPMAKIIKDMSAAVVLIAVLFSVIVGCVIFLPKIFYLFQ